MNKPIGGRGHKAPYETRVIRVPVPLIPEFEKMITIFHEHGDAGILDSSEVAKDMWKRLGYSGVTKYEALAEIKKILKLKKSAKQTAIKLLQVIYGNEITENDLMD